MPPQASPKRQALQATGTLNPRAAHVRHGLFQHSDFFDPQDLLQLKYETLRALEQEDCSIARAAQEFGLSRPTIYQAQNQFQAGGLEGLLPRKRGPKHAHKLTEPVRQYLADQVRAEPAVGGPELARRVRQRFGIKLHRRTIEKALKSKAKRGPQTPS
jgi:transposase